MNGLGIGTGTGQTDQTLAAQAAATQGSSNIERVAVFGGQTVTSANPTMPSPGSHTPDTALNERQGASATSPFAGLTSTGNAGQIQRAIKTEIHSTVKNIKDKSVSADYISPEAAQTPPAEGKTRIHMNFRTGIINGQDLKDIDVSIAGNNKEDKLALQLLKHCLSSDIRNDYFPGKQTNEGEGKRDAAKDAVKYLFQPEVRARMESKIPWLYQGSGSTPAAASSTSQSTDSQGSIPTPPPLPTTNESNIPPAPPLGSTASSARSTNSNRRISNSRHPSTQPAQSPRQQLLDGIHNFDRSQLRKVGITEGQNTTTTNTVSTPSSTQTTNNASNTPPAPPLSGTNSESNIPTPPPLGSIPPASSPLSATNNTPAPTVPQGANRTNRPHTGGNSRPVVSNTKATPKSTPALNEQEINANLDSIIEQFTSEPERAAYKEYKDTLDPNSKKMLTAILKHRLNDPSSKPFAFFIAGLRAKGLSTYFNALPKGENNNSEQSLGSPTTEATPEPVTDNSASTPGAGSTSSETATSQMSEPSDNSTDATNFTSQAGAEITMEVETPATSNSTPSATPPPLPSTPPPSARPLGTPPPIPTSPIPSTGRPHVLPNSQPVGAQSTIPTPPPLPPTTGNISSNPTSIPNNSEPTISTATEPLSDSQLNPLDSDTESVLPNTTGDISDSQSSIPTPPPLSTTTEQSSVPPAPPLGSVPSASSVSNSDSIPTPPPLPPTSTTGSIPSNPTSIPNNSEPTISTATEPLSDSQLNPLDSDTEFVLPNTTGDISDSQSSIPTPPPLSTTTEQSSVPPAPPLGSVPSASSVSNSNSIPTPPPLPPTSTTGSIPSNPTSIPNNSKPTVATATTPSSGSQRPNGVNGSSQSQSSFLDSIRNSKLNSTSLETINKSNADRQELDKIKQELHEYRNEANLHAPNTGDNMAMEKAINSLNLAQAKLFQQKIDDVDDPEDIDFRDLQSILNEVLAQAPKTPETRPLSPQEEMLSKIKGGVKLNSAKDRKLPEKTPEPDKPQSATDFARERAQELVAAHPEWASNDSEEDELDY